MQCTNKNLNPEQQIQFALWSIFAAPLMISADLRSMPIDSKVILQNKEVIAIETHSVIHQIAIQEVIASTTCAFSLKPSGFTNKKIKIKVNGPRIKLIFFLEIVNLNLRNNRIYLVIYTDFRPYRHAELVSASLDIILNLD